MLLPDVNVLLYAYRPSQSDVAGHVGRWLWDRTEDGERLAVSTAILSSVIRIATHPRAFTDPAPPRDASRFAQSILDDPAVTVVVPSSRHWPIFRGFIDDLRIVGNDVPDAYLAALAIDHGATLVTTDRGFRRFPGLRLVDPLAV